MSAAYVSAIVAGIAVVVGALMQFLTLRRSRESSEGTLIASERTARMAALSSATTVWEQGLRDDLAQYATLTYEVETSYAFAMAKKLPWPGDYAEEVAEVETVFNRILLRLDLAVSAELQLMESVKKMRDDKQQLWVDRRQHLVEAARSAFRARWSEIL